MIRVYVLLFMLPFEYFFFNQLKTLGLKYMQIPLDEPHVAGLSPWLLRILAVSICRLELNASQGLPPSSPACSSPWRFI